jgi:excisionase family DNA binding protein
MSSQQAVQTEFEPRIGRSVSLDHAAEILGVSRRTIYNRIRDGRLLTIRTRGGSQRVLLDSVLEMRRRGVEARPGPVVERRHGC